jgi:drug/metabolite transporter (DMT)-like permease
MPIILALLSSLVWGLADFLGGTLSKKRKAIAVIGGSQSFGLLFASVLALAFGLWTWDSTVWINGAIAGGMGLLGLVGFYTALATGQMGIVAPISSLSAVVPVTIGLAQGERPHLSGYSQLLPYLVRSIQLLRCYLLGGFTKSA